MDGSTVSPAPIQVCHFLYCFLLPCYENQLCFWLMKFSNLCSLQICFLRNLGRDVQRTATLLGLYCITSKLRE